MSGKHEVRIIDTTLRDGEQMPGISFSQGQKIVLAEKIARFGADIIELMPVVSEGEQAVARAVARLDLGAQMRAVCRLKKEDVDISSSCGADRLLLVAPASDLHIRVKFGITREEALARLVEIVEYARSRCGKVDVALEDASRADVGYLTEISEALTGKADYLLIGDTLGVLTPSSTTRLIGTLKRAKSACRLEFHGHDDFGLAVANTLAAIVAGADAFTATFLGIGERAGNAAMEEVLVALKHLEGLDLGARLDDIVCICSEVARSIGVTIPANKAWAGSNAFAHESGIHADAVLKDPTTYEAIPPGTVGGVRRILFGKKTGRHALDRMLRGHGLELSSEELLSVRKRVQDHSEEHRRALSELEVLALAGVK